MNEEHIFSLDRPAPALLKLYCIKSLLTGPFAIILLPLLFFRYYTLRYNFDNEGITMRWGILFRRQVHLTYARIQDIHLTSGILQRWFNLADVQIQTASGNASAEMVIEGLHEYEDIRNFIYGKMRGHKNRTRHAPVDTVSSAVDGNGYAADIVFKEILEEIRASRKALEDFISREKEQ